MNMITHLIYSLPGSLVFAALLAWPASRQDSQSLFERIRFCLLSMMAFALFVWGLQQPPIGFNGDFGFLPSGGTVIALMATVFLVVLWFDKVTEMLTDMLFGCMDMSNDGQMDLNYETRQIEEAVQSFQTGKRRRALRLCNRIIESKSQYGTTATTLAYWIENPGRLRFISPPRTNLKHKGRFGV